MDDDEVRRLVESAAKHPEDLVRIELADFRQMLARPGNGTPDDPGDDPAHMIFSATWNHHSRV